MFSCYLYIEQKRTKVMKKILIIGTIFFQSCVISQHCSQVYTSNMQVYTDSVIFKSVELSLSDTVILVGDNSFEVKKVRKGVNKTTYTTEDYFFDLYKNDLSMVSIDTWQEVCLISNLR